MITMTELHIGNNDALLTSKLECEPIEGGTKHGIHVRMDNRIDGAKIADGMITAPREDDIPADWIDPILLAAINETSNPDELIGALHQITAHAEIAWTL